MARGFQIHKAPRLAAGHRKNFEPGTIVTIEPGIYLPGWGGIEDPGQQIGHSFLPRSVVRYAETVERLCPGIVTPQPSPAA
jgi:hypothetical protein